MKNFDVCINSNVPVYLVEGTKIRIQGIIFETFVDTADQDFILARSTQLLAQQHRAFFWPALQCLEKYLKACLLLNGIPVKEFSHNITKMAEILSEKCDVFKSLRLTPLAQHQELLDAYYWGEEDVMTFLRHIEEFGNASNRYNYFGVLTHFSTVLKLDQVVWTLRNQLKPGERLVDGDATDEWKIFAYDQNYLFAPTNWKHRSPLGLFSSTLIVPDIELGLKGVGCDPKAVEDWLRENIRISDREIERIKSTQ